MNTRTILPIVLCLLSGTATADTDSMSILKADSSVAIRKTTDMAADRVSYSIDICPAVDTCDRFLTSQDQLAALADFSFLYAVYMPDDLANDNRLTPPREKPLAFVQQAKRAGTAQPILTSYAAQFACKTDASLAPCVLHGLAGKFGIEHYKIQYVAGMAEVFWPDPSNRSYVP